MKGMEFLIFLLPLLLCAAPRISEEEGVRRIKAHLLIDDPASALREAEELLEAYPTSRKVGTAVITALAANECEEKALSCWNRLAINDPDLLQDRNLLEELAWGVLHKGINSTQYAIRLSAMIGAYLTHDVRAVPVLLRMMRDSNAIIRSVAVQMATHFADAPLQDEVQRLMEEEKIWFVRLEVIKAAGVLRMKSLVPQLQAILNTHKNTFEERKLAAEALVRIYDRITLEEFIQLAKSNRAGMRHLACMLAVHFQVKDAKEELILLSQDSNPDVRIAALNALGLLWGNLSLMSHFRTRAEEESHPAVAITASWALALVDAKESEAHFARWLKDDLPENRRLAASALAATGGRCSAFAQQMVQESTDPYVRANLAIGLIGQRADVKLCADILYDFMRKEKRMWMWDDRANPLFHVLAPSQIRHIDQIPNYPEAIDQMTRLNLVSLLALIEDPRAQDALKSFLQYKTWGITGVAAATLIQEGDEEAMEVVRSLLHDEDLNVRLQACLVLALFAHDERVISELQNAYVRSDHERKMHILEAVGSIGNEESASFFIQVLQEPFQMLRVAAAAGLIKSLNK
jgi:HEAT repeat protein